MADKIEETKYDKFKRLVEKRVNNVLNDLRLLGNLANRHNYDYKDSDIKKIMKTIDESVKKMKLKFESNQEFEQFSLD